MLLLSEMKTARVVSLVPSCTEIVCALGCRDQLVGRSHECDFPADVRDLPACTSAKVTTDASSAEIDREIKSLLQRGLLIYEINAGLLRQLRPRLVLTQALCDVCAVSVAEVEAAVAELAGTPAKVVSVSPLRLADLWKDIATIADALGAAEEGRTLLAALKNRLVDVIQKTCVFQRRPTVACLEWFEPLMAAGNWMPELVDFAGGVNLFGQAGLHSPWLEWKELAAKNPDIIVLMPCGFDLARARHEAAALAGRPEWRGLRAVKSGNVFVTDGNHYFNRPGPRLVDSLEILTEILHPKLFSFGHQGKGWQKL